MRDQAQHFHRFTLAQDGDRCADPNDPVDVAGWRARARVREGHILREAIELATLSVWERSEVYEQNMIFYWRWLQCRRRQGRWRMPVAIPRLLFPADTLSGALLAGDYRLIITEKAGEGEILH